MTTAITAGSFINTLGVDTHIGISGAYSNLSLVEQDLSYLGVPIVRDSIDSAGVISQWQQVAQATGVKFDDFMPEGAPAWDQSALALVPQLVQAGLLAYVEGGNEADDSYAIANGNSLQWTAQFQQQVYAMGKQVGLPVINMSFGQGWTAANNWQGDYGTVGNLSAYADYANAHTYANPGETSSAAMNLLNGDAQLAASGRSVITTEMGWQTSQFSATQIAQDAVDATFDGILSGNAGTWFYGLYDDASGTWGLFNSDGSARPVATAIHDLTTLLADSGGSNFTPGSLNYSLSGTVSGDNSFLMEKSDGSYWIGLWNESAGQHTVTVNLPSNASAIEVYDPITGTSAIQSASNASSISVSLGSDPLLVEVISNGSSPPTSTLTASSSGTSGNAGSTSSTSSGSSGGGSSTTTGGSGSSSATASNGGSSTSADPSATAGGAPGTPTDLTVSAPGSVSVAAGGTVAINGASVTDSWAAGNGGAMALNVWDQSGTLTIGGQTFGPGGGPVAFGMLSGSVAQINADLASMTYTASGTASSDTITVDVWNQAGVEVKETIPVTITSSSGAASTTSTSTTSATGTAAATGAASTGNTTGTASTAAASGSAASSTTTSNQPTPSNTISISAGDASPVVTVSNTAITATSGDHMLFISGTGDVATLTGGTETVQSYVGGNTITTGSGNDTIKIAGSGNVVDAGGGNNTIEDSGSNNTIVLPTAGGNDNVYGWVAQNGDQFDLRSALASTSWDGSEGTIGNYISVSDQGNNAVISLNPAGGSGGSVIATLNDAAPMTLSTLLQHAIT